MNVKPDIEIQITMSLLLPSWLRCSSDSSRILDWSELLESKMRIIQDEARETGLTDILTTRNNKLNQQCRHRHPLQLKPGLKSNTSVALMD